MSFSIDKVAMAELKKKAKSIALPKITELVLQTARFSEMKNWYEAVIGRDWFLENTPDEGVEITRYGNNHQVRAAEVHACFMLMDDDFPYGQILAIFELPFLNKEAGNDPGMNHVRYGQANLPELFDRFEALRDVGIVPHRSSNHGQSTSFYYLDPDRNVVEFTAPNYDNFDEYIGYMKSDAFKADPSGIEVNPDEFVARFRNGEPQSELIKF